jgi:hypothetical protein
MTTLIRRALYQLAIRAQKLFKVGVIIRPPFKGVLPPLLLVKVSFVTVGTEMIVRLIFISHVIVPVHLARSPRRVILFPAPRHDSLLKIWLAKTGLNRRPLRYQRRAPPAELFAKT